MVTAIHIEIDVLFLLLLGFIAYQSRSNVSQQMSRVLFRNTVYGIMSILLLDMLWLLVDGQTFSYAVALNYLINIFFLAGGVFVGCLWYLYVLETLGYPISRGLQLAVLSPGLIITALNLISLHTGWIFTVDAENHYVRGPYFWIQLAFAILVLLVSFFHILIRLLDKRPGVPRRALRRLLWFYVIPVVGTLVTMPFTAMPGTWPCAAVAVILIYMDDQDNEIVRDSLTGLNNRKTLSATFAEYSRKTGAAEDLDIFVIDLNDFKKINDTFGHPTGDEALVKTADILREAAENRKAVVARTGGDEFLVMGFFPGEDAPEAFRKDLKERFARFNREEGRPYRLDAEVGFAPYKPGAALSELIDEADEMLYR